MTSVKLTGAKSDSIIDFVPIHPINGTSDSSSDLFDRGLLDAGLSCQCSSNDLDRSFSVDVKGGSKTKGVSIPKLFRDFKNRDEPVKICAPMVRYSKLGFRRLTRLYGVDLAFSPMIVADAFIKSVKARDSDLTTDPDRDRPLVVQFAAKDAFELSTAAEIIRPFADGVDLNCGCPQRWAIQEGFGCCLLKKPELVREMVEATKMRLGSQSGINCGNSVDKEDCVGSIHDDIDKGCQGLSDLAIHDNNHESNSSNSSTTDCTGNANYIDNTDCTGDLNHADTDDFTVSIKIRIDEDIRKTVDLCQKAEAVGVDFITVHGRTPAERHQPVHLDMIKTVVDSVKANGKKKKKKKKKKRN